MRFRAARRGTVADVDPLEAEVLSSCVRQLLELLGEEEHGADPLAALVGLPAGLPADAVRPPEDPALTRLLPDAYPDDAQASQDFRRYTEADLRAAKRAAARTVLETLPPSGGRLVLDRDQALAWLGCLNDLRLVLGTRLDVREDTDLEEEPPHTARGQALHLYGWLGWLQESLVAALSRHR